MIHDRAAITRSCFAPLLVAGFCLIVMGLVIEPVMPWFALDRVLTPKELANPETTRSTLALLKRAQGGRWLFWALAGVFVVSISGLGLWATSRRNSPSADDLISYNPAAR